jgi:Domain of unknown function (DUF4334)/GXWXG protein
MAMSRHRGLSVSLYDGFSEEGAAVNLKERFEELAARREPTQLAQLDTLFDSLPAVSDEFMLGEWQGGVFNTGHPGEQQLQGLAWAGKSFRGRNDVDPIVSLAPDGTRQCNPVLGAACLRKVEHRGIVTATMVYDNHPIFDHFRGVDAQTVLGVMDRKGEPMPLYFYLRRI